MLPERSLPDTVTLARLETRWHAPWLVAGLSHWGQHHAEIGLPNQDAFACGSVGRTTWLALADGVSACPHSGEGAQFVVRTVGEQIAHRLRTSPNLTETQMVAAFDATRELLAASAKRSGHRLADFATTLLVAVLSETGITVGKIGDGYVLAVERSRNQSKLVPLVESPVARQAGEVIDLTNPSWKSAARVRHIPDRIAAGIDTVALASDGCDRFFVRTANSADDAKRQAVLTPELIDTHLATNLKQLGGRNLFAYLAQLMAHPKFNDEGDDRTMLVATAMPSKGLPCFPSTA